MSQTAEEPEAREIQQCVGVYDAMPCNTMQNVSLERKRREGEGKKGCDLSICRGLLSCREGMQNCIRGFTHMGQKCAQRQG